jgi:hypothetical protein
MGIWKRYLKWMEENPIDLVAEDEDWIFRTPTQIVDLRTMHVADLPILPK